MTADIIHLTLDGAPVRSQLSFEDHMTHMREQRRQIIGTHQIAIGALYRACANHDGQAAITAGLEVIETWKNLTAILQRIHVAEEFGNGRQ